MPDRLITMKQVCEYTTFSETWIRKLVQHGKFHKPKKVGERAIRFLESEVNEWVQNPSYIGDEARQADRPSPASSHAAHQDTARGYI